MKCPLLQKDMVAAPCNRCMYSNDEEECLFNRQMTPDEFAKQKGVPYVKISASIEKAENRIKAGLLLACYVEWFKTNKRELLQPDRKSVV